MSVPDLRHALPLRPEPERMTGRAQVYLAVTAVTHALMAYVCGFREDWFKASSYQTIRGVMPLPAWSAIFLVSALVCTYAALRRSETAARIGLILAASFIGTWEFGLVAAAINGTLAGPTGLIGWGALVAKDLIVCLEPLRTPLEPVLRRIEARRREREVTDARG